MIPNMDQHLTTDDIDSTTLINALSTLSPLILTSLSTTLTTTFRHHRHRISTMISSPPIFASTLNHLYSLTLPNKSLLIAKYLLSTLHLISPFLSPSPHQHPPYASTSTSIRLRDLDAVLLLLLFCEIRQHDPTALETTSPHQWHRLLASYHIDAILCLSGVKVSPNEVVRSLVDVVGKCRRFVGSAHGCTATAGRDVAASVAAVVGLPSVEAGAARGECVICKEEMEEGRDVCELPCEHLFHWMCVLRWLRTRNTCPCCRHRLPTDDVYGEIDRLWEVVVRAAHPYVHVDACT